MTPRRFEAYRRMPWGCCSGGWSVGPTQGMALPLEQSLAASIVCAVDCLGETRQRRWRIVSHAVGKLFSCQRAAIDAAAARQQTDGLPRRAPRNRTESLAGVKSAGRPAPKYIRSDTSERGERRRRALNENFVISARRQLRPTGSHDGLAVPPSWRGVLSNRRAFLHRSRRAGVNGRPRRTAFGQRDDAFDSSSRRRRTTIVVGKCDDEVDAGCWYV